ncbi:MAG: BamA/TamA family outer membrane protein, partial [Saprospiraceae bacterium]
SMRGYETDDLFEVNVAGASIFNKLSVELRYPISLNPSATVFVLGFFEGGNAWDSFKNYNPLDLKRSAGGGIRVFLPMFGMLGFDYGWGWDRNVAPGSKASAYGNFNIILGFEPE